MCPSIGHVDLADFDMLETCDKCSLVPTGNPPEKKNTRKCVSVPVPLCESVRKFTIQPEDAQESGIKILAMVFLTHTFR